MSFNDNWWLLNYARDTSPEVAARNNNASGRKMVLDSAIGADEHLTADELKELEPWVFRFLLTCKKEATT